MNGCNATQRAKIAEKVHKPPFGVNVINFELNGLTATIWVSWSHTGTKNYNSLIEVFKFIWYVERNKMHFCTYSVAFKWNHCIEWPVFSDIGLNFQSQGEKGRTSRKYNILIGSQVLLTHDLPFSHGHPLGSKGRFVNLFGNFSPLCARSSKCAKIGLSNTVVYVKNHLNLSKIYFHVQI